MIMIILIVVATLLTIFVILGGTYSITDFGKRFYHDILGWHKPNNADMRFDGCSLHSKCKFCGKDIMQDSQGNWF